MNNEKRNCPECGFEPENGHGLTCSKHVEADYVMRRNFVKIFVATGKPWSDFPPEKNHFEIIGNTGLE